MQGRCFSKTWLLSNGCEESRESYYHKALFDVNQSRHMWVKCWLTYCFSKCATDIRGNCESPQKVQAIVMQILEEYDGNCYKENEMQLQQRPGNYVQLCEGRGQCNL